MRNGCSGSCPLSVVVRSNKADGAPAKCFICDQKYGLPKGAQQRIAAGKEASKRNAMAKGLGKGKGKEPNPSKADADLARQAKSAQNALEKLKEEMRELKESIKGKPSDEGNGTPPSEEVTQVNSQIREVEKSIYALGELPIVLRTMFYPKDGDYDAKIKDLERQKAELLGKKMGFKPLDLRESSAKTFADKCAKQLDEAEKDKGKIAEEIQALQERLHAQATIVMDRRTKSTKANEELAKIKEEVATAARNSLPASKVEHEGDAAGKPPGTIVCDALSSDPRATEFELAKKLKECSDEDLRKLGYIALDAESKDGHSKPEEGGQKPKKQKLSQPEFDELMAVTWKASFEDEPQEGATYELWSNKFQKNHKWAPY